MFMRHAIFSKTLQLVLIFKGNFLFENGERVRRFPNANFNVGVLRDVA